MKKIKIEEVENITKEEFEKKYLLKGNPVVIRNGYKYSKTLEWSFEYLSKKCGENEVNVRKNVNEG
jgi:hypothetical protein